MVNEKRELESGRYRHYKGGEYDVIGIGVHTESGEKTVVYRSPEALNAVHFWIRPLEMFLEDVEVDGGIQPRFKKID